MPLLRNPWLTFAIFCGALTSTILAVRLLYYGGHRIGSDFEVFWRAARTPLNHVYDPAPLPFVYPPPTLAIFKSLLWLLPFWPAFILWSAAGVIIYRRAAGTSLLILISPVVVQCLAFGQTALLLGSAINFASRRTAIARGALLGSVFALKPQLVVFAPVILAFRRDWAGLFAFCVAILALVLFSLATVGIEPWFDWIHALPAFRKTISDYELWGVVVTPYSYAVQLGINPVPVVATCLGLALAGVWLAPKNSDKVELICLTSLLVTPYAGGSDIAILLPFAFRRLQDDREPLKIWAALTYISALTPIANLIGLFRLWRSPEISSRVSVAVPSP
jgi:hypothetical protein